MHEALSIKRGLVTVKCMSWHTSTMLAFTSVFFLFEASRLDPQGWGHVVRTSDCHAAVWGTPNVKTAYSAGESCERERECVCVRERESQGRVFCG